MQVNTLSNSDYFIQQCEFEATYRIQEAKREQAERLQAERTWQEHIANEIVHHQNEAA
ncbi:MAG: hypothetical protein V4615_05060 [Bacteroidota bacterium]